MNELVITLGWVGIFGAMALGAVGSIIGCAVAGQAAIGAMLETDGGYGRFVGISAMPSSQIIYGIVIMFSLSQNVTAANGGERRLTTANDGQRQQAVTAVAGPSRPRGDQR